MLKGISPLLSPALLATLCEMGHGDEIVLADAHFPAASLARRLVRADGLGIAELLDAILPLFELDSYVGSPVSMMAPVAGDVLDPEVEESYRAALMRHTPATAPPARIERFAFYERARQAFAVVATGDTAKYGNVILKKGVTPVVGAHGPV
jgi:L-fucose mutarotase